MEFAAEDVGGILLAISVRDRPSEHGDRCPAVFENGGQSPVGNVPLRKVRTRVKKLS
jgi:hypothetical protein